MLCIDLFLFIQRLLFYNVIIIIINIKYKNLNNDPLSLGCADYIFVHNFAGINLCLSCINLVTCACRLLTCVCVDVLFKQMAEIMDEGLTCKTINGWTLPLKID